MWGKKKLVASFEKRRQGYFKLYDDFKHQEKKVTERSSKSLLNCACLCLPISIALAN